VGEGRVHFFIITIVATRVIVDGWRVVYRSGGTTSATTAATGSQQ
jgi:hypothetical protein